MLYISALWIAASFKSGSTSYPIKMHIYTGIVNSTHYYWNLTLSTRVIITNIHFSQVIYNSVDVQSSEKYYIVTAKWYNDIDGGFTAIPQEFVDNFIMAVTAFETVDGRCGFEYNWDFATKTIDG